MTFGLSVDEMIRAVEALQVAASGERLAPEGWRPDQPLLPPVQDADGADWFCRRAP